MTGATLPGAVAPLVAFGQRLRRHGFAVAPEQTIAWLAAVQLLGPRHMGDLYRAAVATLAPPPERLGEFDALFQAHFYSVATPVAGGEADSGPDEPASVVEEAALELDAPGDEPFEGGAQAAAAERLAQRQFAPNGGEAALARLQRLGPGRLPRRRGYRSRPARRGEGIHGPRALRSALRHDGEVLSLPRRQRRPRQRPLLLLIDVSGSMKDYTASYLAAAHTLVQVADRCEVFTLGTRLTRITRPLRVRQRAKALQEASGLVADWDGGTRLGEALQGFLALPRYLGLARGAAVVVLSDGLERGDPKALVNAVQRLTHLAWRVTWLTPLAADSQFRPATAALTSLASLVELGDGSNLPRLCHHLLTLDGGRL
ncbi:MAG: VWA domain-containing protein [Candidatus Competibacterales bacterium]